MIYGEHERAQKAYIYNAFEAVVFVGALRKNFIFALKVSIEVGFPVKLIIFYYVS